MIVVLINIICFFIFCIIQSIVINGIYECFSGGVLKDDINKTEKYQGMVFYMIAPRFFERNKRRNWSKPLWSCVKCMSSVYGAITFWPTVLIVYGFYPIEILIFIFDVFMLVYLNYYFHKKI